MGLRLVGHSLRLGNFIALEGNVRPAPTRLMSLASANYVVFPDTYRTLSVGTIRLAAKFRYTCVRLSRGFHYLRKRISPYDSFCDRQSVLRDPTPLQGDRKLSTWEEELSTIVNPGVTRAAKSGPGFVIKTGSGDQWSWGPLNRAGRRVGLDSV